MKIVSHLLIVISLACPFCTLSLLPPQHKHFFLTGHTITQRKKKAIEKSCVEQKCPSLTQTTEQIASHEESFHSKIAEVWQDTSRRRSRPYCFHRHSRVLLVLKPMGFAPQPCAMEYDCDKTDPWIFSVLRDPNHNKDWNIVKKESRSTWTCSFQKSSHSPPKGSLIVPSMLIRPTSVSLPPLLGS